MKWYTNIGDDLLRHRQIKFMFSQQLQDGYTSDALQFTHIFYEYQNEYVLKYYTLPYLSRPLSLT